MAATREKTNVNGSEASQGSEEMAERRPRSLKIASEGVRTSADFNALMSALMTDVIEGTLTPGVSNAAVNAGGKLLKSVELEIKYGMPGPNGRALNLCSNGSVEGDKEKMKAHFAKLRHDLDEQEARLLR